MKWSYRWRFPMPRTHTGMLLGNGRLGAMVWGGGDTLCVTLGRADVWDHRGGATWTAQMSYANILAMIEAGEEAKLDDLFRGEPAKSGEPPRPTMLPLGRFELRWPGVELLAARLDMRRGEVRVRVGMGSAHHVLMITLLPDEPVVLVSLPEPLCGVEIRRVTSWEHVGERLAQVLFKPPQMFESDGMVGWMQDLPADPSYCAACGVGDGMLSMAVTRGKDGVAARGNAAAMLSVAADAGYKAGARRASLWWGTYWQGVARVETPNRRLQFLHDYGMYKFGAMTNPLGVPAALQGPWIEEYQLPPWSNDYHFNVNVQMCYQPAYQGNCLHHLCPLFEMVHRWTDKLRHNARQLVGVEDGRLLPHAVSDTGEFIPMYWAHSVDHASTAWVAQMMYRYYRFTMDEAFLREVAFAFMLGTLRVYEAMLELDGSGRYRLRVGVSPEYFAADGRGYGVNASVQLAAVHRLLEDVIEATEVLGVEVEAKWRQMQANLPKAALVGPENRRRIGIWEGQDLDESHRHFSHLAGITPLDVLDMNDPQWQPVIERSLRQWISRGAGQWCGWSMAWASMLHSRVGNADAAELWLEMFERVFTNEGHGTLYGAKFPGLSLIGIGSMPRTIQRAEIMQCDGGMGATAAIQEMLLHTRRGVNYLFAGAPQRWRSVAFKGMRTEGAFLVSARRAEGRVERVVVRSEAGGVFRLGNCFGGDTLARSPGVVPRTLTGRELEIHMERGQCVTLTPFPAGT